MTHGGIRVLVVDDSAFARKALREMLCQRSDIEVVGFARDGLEALEKIAELQPDVVTLDLVMPNLDGLGVLRALPRESAPRVVVVSSSDAEGALGVEALHSGAVDLVHKPSSLATDVLYDIETDLIAKVRAAAGAVLRRASGIGTQSRTTVQFPAHPRHTKLVVIGTSTGGPQALTRLLTSLPAGFPVPIAVALHIPPGYTDALAKRLDAACAISVVEADEGMELLPGRVVVARGGCHLKVRHADPCSYVYLSDQPSTSSHFPAVDVLFETAAAAAGAGVLGVVLTGMGDDGLIGARAVHAAGGLVITEAESSCVVYGMPRCVWEAQLSCARAPIDRMADELMRHVS